MDERTLNDFLELLRLVMSQSPGGTLTQPQLQPYLSRLSPYITLDRIRKGQNIIRMFQSLQTVILVVRGEFYLTRSSASGMSSMVARVWAPEFLGIPQLIEEDKLFYSNIIASENCLCLDIDCAFFDWCMRTSPEVAIQCVKCMSRSRQRNYRQIERLSFFNATENLMSYLYRKWVEAGAKEELLCVKEKRALIADELSCTVRTVCRALQSLKEQDMCTTDSAGHIYCTPEQLQRIRRAYQ